MGGARSREHLGPEHTEPDPSPRWASALQGTSAKEGGPARGRTAPKAGLQPPSRVPRSRPQILLDQARVRQSFSKNGVAVTLTGATGMRVDIPAIGVSITFNGRVFQARLSYSHFSHNTEGQCGEWGLEDACGGGEGQAPPLRTQSPQGTPDAHPAPAPAPGGKPYLVAERLLGRLGDEGGRRGWSSVCPPSNPALPRHLHQQPQG